MILGGAGADQITACAQYANSVGVPYLSAGVNQTGLDKLKTYFAISMTYAQQAPLLSQLVKNNLKKTAVAMITEDTPSFVDARAAAKKAFGALGKSRSRPDETISKNASSSESQARVAEAEGLRRRCGLRLWSPTLFLNPAAAGQARTTSRNTSGPGSPTG